MMILALNVANVESSGVESGLSSASGPPTRITYRIYLTNRSVQRCQSVTLSGLVRGGRL